MDDVVLFEELATACGRRWGVATLNAPAALNALSLPMVQLLMPRLQAWAQDADVVGVVLRAAGEKAFCAGGDLRELYQSLRRCGAGPNAYAEAFFAQEYALDHLIHTYPKPVLCWGHGIVMGGGIGLFAGASHRVVTPQSRLAMPEISIGLYPDVGGSWFLPRLPGRTGLFLALTGAPLQAADALFSGLADVALEHASQAAVLQAIGTHHWSGAAQQHRAALSRLLAAHAVHLPAAASQLHLHFDAISERMAGNDLADIAARLRTLQTGEAWLDAAGANFRRGSPSSAALAWALWQRARHLSLAEVFALELRVSLGCCAHPDFAEGIRALLIDKDRQPRWTPAVLEDVTPRWIEAHFAPRGSTAPQPLHQETADE